MKNLALLWAALAAVAFAGAGYALWTDDRRLSFLMIGLLVGPFLLYFAWTAHRRASVVLYVLLRKPRPAADLGDDYWQPGPYREVVGYTAMGNALLRNPADGRYCGAAGVLRRRDSARGGPLRVARRVRGAPPAAAGVARRAAGRAGDGRAPPVRSFGEGPDLHPDPYPMFAKTPERYDRGDYWVFMDLVGQTVEQLGL
jgi:hypothetical protein